MTTSRLFGLFLLAALVAFTLTFKNYGFTLTQSLVVGIFSVGAAFLFYRFILIGKKVRLRTLLIFSVGFFLGVYLSKAITLSLYPIFVNFPYLQEVLYLTLPYTLGFAAVELTGNKPISEILKEEKGLYCTVKILDTSAIIDGRIIGVAESGFLEGKVVIPRFVIEELQSLSDSFDPKIRTKGKKGLEIVGKLIKFKKPPVVIYEADFPWIKEVDDKLIELCKRLNAKLVTTDYNLNRVASIKGIGVANVNELSNALKPMLAVGEELIVFVSREGKEKNQGVGYLDDGTMVVVDNGKHLVGHRIKAVVNNVLQSASGRIIFVKSKEVIK